MARPFPPTDDLMVGLIEEALRSKIAKSLKEPLMVEAEKHVDAAVALAMADLETRITAYYSNLNMTTTFEVLLKRA